MAFSSIDKGSKYFNTVTYTGNNSTGNSITGVGFQPDFVWIKRRSGDTNDHVLFDSVRGATKRLISNLTNAESTNTDTLSAFNSDGFTVNINDTVNASSPYVSWNWLGANTTASNTSGTITSTVSANTTSGFSIVSYTGTGSNGATVGHGLGVAPSMIIFKSRNSATSWVTYHKSLGATNFVALSATDASSASALPFNNTAPTSTVFTLGTSGGTNSTSMIAYCFAEVKGFSKFGSYTGNGNADGTFVYTGFKPAYLMIKNKDLGAGYGFWCIWDNKRNVYNPENTYLIANTNEADGSESGGVDFVSNGFKFRNSYDYSNRSACGYIYMAFAENPFVTSKGIPVTAR